MLLTINGEAFQSSQKQNPQNTHAVSATKVDALPDVPEYRWPELMKLNTVSKYLDVSPSTVHRFVNEGIIPSPSVALTGRLRRWSKKQIDEAINGQDRSENSGPSIDDLILQVQRG